MGEPFAPRPASGRPDYRELLRTLNRGERTVSSEPSGLAGDHGADGRRRVADSAQEVDGTAVGPAAPEPEVSSELGASTARYVSAAPEPEPAAGPLAHEGDAHADAVPDVDGPPAPEAPRRVAPEGSASSGVSVLLVQSRQADAGARHDFADLRDRDLVDLFCVLDALDARLDIQTTTAKQERGRNAVQLFIYDRGFFPSSSEYERWREGDPRRKSLPTDSTIRRAFGGSWDDVRAAFGEGPGRPDLTARRGISNGPRFEKPELSSIFTTWVGTLSPSAPLLRDAFEAWLTAEADQPTTDLHRVPRSFDPFRRPDTFGGWRPLLEEHGVADRAARGGTQRRVRSPQYRARLLDPVGPERFGGTPAPPTAPPADMQLTAVRELLASLPDSELWADDRSPDNLRGLRAAASLFGPLVSYPQYNEVRELAREEAFSRALECDWPHSRQLTKRWGSWPQAKVAAKVMTPAEAVAGSTRHRYGDPELEQYLLCALRELGLGMSSTAFDAWRPDHKAERERRGLRPRVPEAALVAARLGEGDFDAAVDRVLAEHPDVRDELEERLFGPSAHPLQPPLRLVA